MTDRKIEPRDGIEVFLNQRGTVSIKQIDAVGDEALIVVHPDDVDQLVTYLREVQAEARELAPKAD